MADYFIGEEFDFSEIQADASLPGNYELEVEIITSTVKETESSVVFRITPGGSITSEPLIHEGRVYFGACDKNIYAVDLGTGKEIWRFSTHGPVIVSVALDKGRLYSTSYDGNLYCLDLNGNLVWKFYAGDRIAARPVVHKDNIYFGCRDGNVYAVKKNGRLAWKFASGGPVGSHVTIYKNRIYFGSFDYNLYVLNMDGKLVWKFGTGDQVGAPVVENDIIYFGSFDQNLYAVNTKGRLLWKFNTDDVIPVGTTLTVADDTVYFGSRDYNMYAIKGGKLLWKFATRNMIFSEPLIEGGIVYFCSSDGNLYAVGKETGRELWRFTAGGPALFPRKSGDIVVFGCHDCNLYAINTKGKLLWKFHTSLNYPATLEEVPEVEHTVVIPSVPIGIKKTKKGAGEKGLGNYGYFKGTYIGKDMRDYTGSELKEGLPGMAYKAGRKVYRK